MFRRRSSSPTEGPQQQEGKWPIPTRRQVRNAKSGRGSKERQGCLGSVVVELQKVTREKLDDGEMNTLQKKTAATQHKSFHSPLAGTSAETLLCHMPNHFFGKHFFLEFPPLFLSPFPPPSPLPPGRDMFLSAASVPMTLLHGGSQSGRSPLSSSILFASKIVCT